MTGVPTLLRGRHYATGAVCDVEITDGFISGLSESCTRRAVGSPDLWIAPGLIDLQVNGFAGHDLCSGATTVDDVSALADAMTEAGVTGFCPTVTTNSQESMLASLRAIARACEALPTVAERVVGIHVEGPYLSREDGPRGAHPPAHVRNPDWDEFCCFQKAAGGRIRLLTLAPELPGAPEFIRRVSDAGVIVAIGHHAASEAQIAAAVEAGARLSTHLGNGAHAMLPRHPNYLWHQLAEDRLAASLIVDGFHLPPEVVKCFVRLKGPERLVLVSDVIAPAGQPAGLYGFMDMQVRVDGYGPVRLHGTPYLAGAAARLAECVSNVQRFAGIRFAEAVMMASSNPARLLGLDAVRGSLRRGARADMAIFTDAAPDGRLMAVIQAGRLAWGAL